MRGGSAYITFTSPHCAKNAVRGRHDLKYDSRYLIVNIAAEGRGRDNSLYYERTNNRAFFSSSNF